jgi:putative transposase
VVEHVRGVLGPDRVSQCRACRVLGQPRSTQRRAPAVPDDEPRLVERMVTLAVEYGRYGYRRVTALLRAEGFEVNHKRIERLWSREGLKGPQKQSKRGGCGSTTARPPQTETLPAVENGNPLAATGPSRP